MKYKNLSIIQKKKLAFTLLKDKDKYKIFNFNSTLFKFSDIPSKTNNHESRQKRTKLKDEEEKKILEEKKRLEEKEKKILEERKRLEEEEKKILEERKRLEEKEKKILEEKKRLEDKEKKILEEKKRLEEKEKKRLEEKEKKILEKEYKNVEKLSEGSFGKTFIVTDPKKNRKFVYKKFKNPDDNPLLERPDYFREINALVNLKDSPFIINIEDFGLEKNTKELFLILESGEQNLQTYLRNNSVSENNMKKIMCEIVMGMNFMHKRGILHRDLKPDNLVIMKDGSIRIIDFGMARMGPYEDIKLSGNAYSLWWRPPEIIMRNVLYQIDNTLNNWIYDGEKCEIWNIAILFIDMLQGCTYDRMFVETKGKDIYEKEYNVFLQMIRSFGIDNLLYTEKVKTLFKDGEKVKSEIIQDYTSYHGGHSDFVFDVSELQTYRLSAELWEILDTNNESIISLIERMMNPNPNKRFSYEQIINHSFFANEKQRMINNKNLNSKKQYCSFTLLSDLTIRNYCILSDWLYEVTVAFKLKKVSYIQAMAIVRILFEKDKSIDTEQFQLYGCIALQLACLIYEIYVPEVKDWVFISDKAFTSEEMNDKGHEIFKFLNGNLNVYSVYDELRNKCKDFKTLNGILTAVALCDTLGLHYIYKSEMKVLETAIEFYNKPQTIKSSIDEMKHLSPSRKNQYKKQLDSKYFKMLLEENGETVTRRYFCLPERIRTVSSRDMPHQLNSLHSTIIEATTGTINVDEKEK